MTSISHTDKTRFHTYVEDAKHCVSHLEFLFDNLGEHVELDYSVKSLEKGEAIYWRCLEQGIPPGLTDLNHFAQLLGQYLGECVIHHTGAKWVLSEEPNAMFAQPCIAGYSEKAWERIYPVHTALNIQALPKTKPGFPGVHDRRVFAAKLEKAISILNHHR